MTRLRVAPSRMGLAAQLERWLNVPYEEDVDDLSESVDEYRRLRSKGMQIFSLAKERWLNVPYEEDVDDLSESVDEYRRLRSKGMQIFSLAEE